MAAGLPGLRESPGARSRPGLFIDCRSPDPARPVRGRDSAASHSPLPPFQPCCLNSPPRAPADGAPGGPAGLEPRLCTGSSGLLGRDVPPPTV